MDNLDRLISIIIAADIVGYTSMMQKNEQIALLKLKHYEETIRLETKQHDGEIVKTYGDGCLLLFPSTVKAIHCAINIQKALRNEPKVPLRIGVHIGEIVRKDHDIFGNGVNVASRIESMGVQNSVLISSDVYIQIKNHPEFQVQKLGSFNFKHVERDIDLYAITNEGLTVPRSEQMMGKGMIKKSASINLDETIAPQNSNRFKKIIFGAISIAIILLFINIFRGSLNSASDGVESNDQTLVASTDKSIAVLAFTNMSSDKEQEYFSDGVSEEILNLLTKIPNLKVISRTSSFSFKGKSVTVEEIGKTLHVNHILEGSVRRSGNTVRITAQLINVADGTHMWSETYNYTMENIFKIQDEIASKVSQHLQLTLLATEIKSEVIDPEAYILYLQGKQVFRQNTRESIINSENLIRQSIDKDSTYAPSWVILSTIINAATYKYGIKSIKEGNTTGMAAAKKALALDPNIALGYTYLADFQRAIWNYEEANRNVQKALRLEPDNAGVIFSAASNAIDLGKMEEGIQLQLKAIELDPVNYISYYNLGIYYLWTEQYENAEIYIQKYLLHYPNSEATHALMSLIHLGKGEEEKALIEVEKEPAGFWKLDAKCRILFALGKNDQANAMFQQLIEEYGDVAQPNIASMYAFRDEVDLAFRWLELSYEVKDPTLQEILNFPEFKNLHGDPRWNEFINKLGLPRDHGYHID